MNGHSLMGYFIYQKRDDSGPLKCPVYKLPPLKLPIFLPPRKKTKQKYVVQGGQEVSTAGLLKNHCSRSKSLYCSIIHRNVFH